MPLCILEAVEVVPEAVLKVMEVVLEVVEVVPKVVEDMLYMLELVNSVRCVLWVLGGSYSACCSVFWRPRRASSVCLRC